MYKRQAVLYVGMNLANEHLSRLWALVANTVLLIVFVGYIVRMEKLKPLLHR